MSPEALPQKDSWMTRPRPIVWKIGMSCAVCLAWTILWTATLSGTTSLVVPAPEDPLHLTEDEIAAIDKTGKPLAGLGLLLGGGGYLGIVIFIAGRPGMKYRVQS